MIELQPLNNTQHKLNIFLSHEKIPTYRIELQMKVREDFTITEKAILGPSLVETASGFTFKTLLRHYAKC